MHAVVRLRQRRVLVLEEAVELRAGRLQQGEVLQPGDDPGLLLVAGALDGDDGRAHLLAPAHPGVVVPRAVDGDPLPGVLLDLDPRARRRLATSSTKCRARSSA